MVETRSDLIFDALETCRREVVKRLKAVNYPLVIDSTRLIVVERENGWGTENKNIKISGLQSYEAQLAICDNSVTHSRLGLREQLEPLANYLNEISDLGTRPYFFGPPLSGGEAILVRYLTKLSFRYLILLKRLDRGEPILAKRLIFDFEEFCDSDEINNLKQFTVTGLKPSARYSYRGVTIRALSREERGAFYVARNNQGTMHEFDMEMVPPITFENFMPSSVVTVSSSRPGTVIQSDPSTFPLRLALALFLNGYEVSSTGDVISYDQPRWIYGWSSGEPFPVEEKANTVDKKLTKREFEKAVDLAYKIPDFSGKEGNAKEIALFRVLKGCGKHWQESPFLDFVIALEAALLDSNKNELGYRFRLYGAIFLGEQRNADETFKKLKSIYDLRSKLVHGSAIKPDDLRVATENAKELAIAIIRKAVESGWPDPKKLDAHARAGIYKTIHNR